MEKLIYRIFITMILCVVLYHSLGVCSFGQKEEPARGTQMRDPFIPLIDNKGNLRLRFDRPPQKITLPQIEITGIGTIGAEPYILVEGEIYKEGTFYRGIKIEKIYVDRVLVIYRDTEFELTFEEGEK